MVDRPATKWIKVTVQSSDISGKPRWTEEGSNGGGLSGANALKNTEKGLYEKIDKHVGQEGLPVAGVPQAVTEKK